MSDHMILPTETSEKTSATAIQKWGGFACFVLAVAFVVPPAIHLFGELRSTFGPLTYDLADFLNGPVWAASLVMAVFALRERIGELAPRRMSLALLVAILAAGAMLAVACIRSANRHYHLAHPDLNLENSIPVLVVWATLVAGVSGAAWHALGWVLILVGSAGWTSHRLPRLLSALYWVAGASSLLVYALPENEGNATVFCLVISIWQGILLLKAGAAETQKRITNLEHP